MIPAQSIIKRPLLTEKSTTLRETGGTGIAFGEESNFGQKVVFEVAKDANKIQIRNAVQELWKVKVTDVHTMIVRGRTKRVGRSAGWRSGFKKAIVTLEAGENIEFYEGV